MEAIIVGYLKIITTVKIGNNNKKWTIMMMIIIIMIIIKMINININSNQKY